MSLYGIVKKSDDDEIPTETESQESTSHSYRCALDVSNKKEKSKILCVFDVLLKKEPNRAKHLAVKEDDELMSLYGIVKKSDDEIPTETESQESTSHSYRCALDVSNKKVKEDDELMSLYGIVKKSDDEIPTETESQESTSHSYRCALDVSNKKVKEDDELMSLYGIVKKSDDDEIPTETESQESTSHSYRCALDVSNKKVKEDDELMSLYGIVKKSDDDEIPTETESQESTSHSYRCALDVSNKKGKSKILCVFDALQRKEPNRAKHLAVKAVKLEEDDELKRLYALMTKSDDFDDDKIPTEIKSKESTPHSYRCTLDVFNKPNTSKTLCNIDIFEKKEEAAKVVTKSFNDMKQLGRSEIHGGDTDSSDDEDNKYSTNQKYTESGRAIKNVMKKFSNPTNSYATSPSWRSSKSVLAPAQSSSAKYKPTDVYCDPFFGIRIITPLVSSQVLKEKMSGRTPVTFSRLQNHLKTYDKSSDWVVAGAIVSKFTKSSQKGNPYVCWTLSDLREGLQTVSVFLFGKAYKKLWKTNTHIVVAILNPTPLDNNKTDIAALSVCNPEQVMIWGQSKDLGTCKARKKNGEPCTAFVNKNQCEFCVYHVKQEYRKFTARSELQASWGGSLTQLKNKVLGKNEVFYAGKSFTSVKVKPNSKQVVKDKRRLSALFSQCESRFGPESLPMKKASPAQSARVQLMKDAERLQKLTGSPATLASLSLEGTKAPEVNGKQKSVCDNNSSKVLKKEKGDSKSQLLRKTSDLNTLAKSRLWTSDLKISKQTEKQSKSIITDSTSKNKTVGQQKVNSGLSNPNGNNRTQPTKNRFESLTKLTSIHSKNNELEISRKIRSKTSKALNSSRSANIVDVSFEFEDEGENCKRSAPVTSITSTSNNLNGSIILSTTHKIKPFKTEKIPKKINSFEIDSFKSVDSKTTPALKEQLLIPLGETKTPTKYESFLNITKQNQNKVETKEEDFLPLECSVKRLQDLVHTNSPKLNKFGSLSMNITSRQSAAKAKALNYVKYNGPIEKEDQSTKKNKEVKTVSSHGAKRKRDAEEDSLKSEKSSVKEQFMSIMNATSKHLDLISNAENQAMDEYYEKMEKKEKMEEKMLATFKVDCKAVRCLQCKYKWFSSAENCRLENHPIKVISAVKRFFQCATCKNRTTTLEIVPTHNCSNCGLFKWIKAPMMRERTSTTVSLSIRGGEQTFINSIETDTNLDLLVPDNS